jgi:hypothetical protein
MYLWLGFLGGCNGIDVAESWQIDRMRVLAVAADPAEPQPGDTVTFRSLIVSPDKPVDCSIWLACDTDGGYGCGLDGVSSATGSGTGDTGAAGSSFVGIDPLTPLAWTVPEDFLADQTEEERLEGRSALVTVLSVADCDGLLEGDIAEAESILEGSPDDVEIAYKRLPVSLARTANHNPEVIGVRVDGVNVAPGVRVELEAAQTYWVEPVLAEGAVETYTYLTEAGLDEERVEEPYFLWYAQEGSYDQTGTLYPQTEVEYTTPTEPSLSEQSIWVVVRDRRGGMGWLEVPIRFR